MEKLVLLTGGNKGIGLELAKLILSQTACKLILTARDPGRLSSAVSELSAKGRVIPYQLDVANPAQVQQIKDQFPKIDILVNNAGVYNKSERHDPQVARETLSTNFHGVMALCDALVGHIPPGGKILNVSAILGNSKNIRDQTLRDHLRDNIISREELKQLEQRYLDDLDAGRTKMWPAHSYCTSKLFLNCFTRKLAEENPSLKINAVHPGWCATDLGGPTAPNTSRDGAKEVFGVMWQASQETGAFFQNGVVSPF